MDSLGDLLQEVASEQAGFKIKQAHAAALANSYPAVEALELAKGLLSDNRYQVRELAVFVLGNIADQLPEALEILRETVGKDGNWRVQEILAKAFDRFCSDNGYEKSLPTVKAWLGNENPNVRRAVTEGLRIWTNRDYFKTHPATAIELLANLRCDPSEYVRKSVGNALRDISRKHPGLVQAELAKWVFSERGVNQVHTLASKFLLKEKTG